MAKPARCLECADHSLVVGELGAMGHDLSEGFQDVMVHCGPAGQRDGRSDSGSWTRTGTNYQEDYLIAALDDNALPDEGDGRDEDWEDFNEGRGEDEEETFSVVDPAVNPVLARGQRWVED